MISSVQICTKERFRVPGEDETFVRLGFAAATLSDGGQRVEAKTKLRDIVVGWIESDNGGRETPDIGPNTIVGALTGRVCYIAGHVWLEYGYCEQGQDVALHVAALSNGGHDTCGVLAEFLPDVEHNFIEGRVSPDHVPWSALTVDFIWNLVEPLFRDGRGVPGKAKLYQPNEIDSMPFTWLQDREGAWVTPLWTVSGTVPEVPGAFQYSYTPDVANDIHNCLTWAARAMDVLVGVNWIVPFLESVGGEEADESVIRQTGRMRHFVRFASKADTVRTSHPRYGMT